MTSRPRLPGETWIESFAARVEGAAQRFRTWTDKQGRKWFGATGPEMDDWTDSPATYPPAQEPRKPKRKKRKPKAKPKPKHRKPPFGDTGSRILEV